MKLKCIYCSIRVLKYVYTLLNFVWSFPFFLFSITLSWHCLINICSKCYQIFQKTFSPAKAHQQWEIARWSNNHYITLLTVNNFENNNLVPFINSLQGQHEIGRIMCNNLCTLLEKMFHSIHPIHFQKMLSYAHYWCSPQLTIL